MSSQRHSGHDGGGNNGRGGGDGGHHLLSIPLAIGVGSALLFLTVLTVWTAGKDLGAWNFPLAMLIATMKATLVCSIFMNLYYDHRENTGIFLTSFIFLAIFVGLTLSDLFFRGDVYVAKGELEARAAQVAAGGKPLFKKPWVPTPELVAKGKDLYAQQCVSCHGAAGKGDGPAAAALNPPPRDFTADAGWKNGRKPTGVFKTLKEGIPGSGMSSFATVPPDLRWAMAHYVITLGPSVTKDTSEDYAKIGVNPNAESAEEKVAESIPVDLAMKRIAEEPPQLRQNQVAHLGPAALGRPGGRLYARNCLGCHGSDAQGGIKVGNLGVYPAAFAVTEPLQGDALDPSRFNQAVLRGVPGTLMPGNGSLSSTQLRDLLAFVREVAAR